MAINKVVNKSTKSHGAMRNVLEYVLRDEKVKENAMADMKRMGLEIINLTIQNFSDKENVIQNLGVDNITQIQKDAQIARANSERDVKIAQSAAAEAANKASVDAQTKIIEQNTEYALKQAALKQQSDTAQAIADAAYKIEAQKRQQEINVAEINANIARREREVLLGQKEVELQEKQNEKRQRFSMETLRFFSLNSNYTHLNCALNKNDNIYLHFLFVYFLFFSAPHFD